MGHAHGQTATGRNRHRLVIALAITAAYMVAEIVGGLVSGSLALLADAGHMLTDVAGLSLALLGSIVAERPPSAQRTYGYYRVEILAAAINALVLLGISLYVLFEAYVRFRDPPAVSSTMMLVIGAGGLVANLASAWVLHDAAAESLTLKGAYLEVLADLIASAGVIAGALIIMQTRWYAVDPLISAAIGLFIVPRTWALLRDAVNVLLEGAPNDLDMVEVRETIAAVDGVVAVHDLHAWSLTSGVNALSAHVVLEPGRDHVAVREAIHARLISALHVHHVTLQMEREGEADHEAHL